MAMHCSGVKNRSSPEERIVGDVKYVKRVAMDRIVSPGHLYVEALIPCAMVFEDGTFGR